MAVKTIAAAKALPTAKAAAHATNGIENHSSQTAPPSKRGPCRYLLFGYSPHVDVHVERVETCAIIA